MLQTWLSTVQSVPNVSVPDVSVPDVSVPDVSVPDVSVTALIHRCLQTRSAETERNFIDKISPYFQS